MLVQPFGSRVATWTDTFVADGSTNVFTLTHAPSGSLISLLWNQAPQQVPNSSGAASGCSLVGNQMTMTLGFNVSNGDVIQVSYPYIP